MTHPWMSRRCPLLISCSAVVFVAGAASTSFGQCPTTEVVGPLNIVDITGARLQRADVVHAGDGRWGMVFEQVAIGGLWMTRSIDGGNIWSPPEYLTPTQRPFLKEPALATSAETWIVASPTFAGDMKIIRSTDHGETWVSTELADFPPGFLPALASEGDTWLLAWVNGTNVYVSRSVDGGSAWSVPVSIGAPLSDFGGVSIATDGAGIWVVTWRRDHDIFMRRSVTNGATWQAAQQVDPQNSEAGSGFYGSAPGIAYGNGIWQIAWNVHGEEGWEIVVSRSADAAVSWSDPQVISTPPNEVAAHAHLTFDGESSWILTWSCEFSNYIFDEDREICLARSHDDGVSWSLGAILNSDAAMDVHSQDFTPRTASDGTMMVTAWGTFYRPPGEPDYICQTKRHQVVLLEGIVDCDDNGIDDTCELYGDCNSNGVLDLCDILEGGSTDLNFDLAPDECGLPCFNASTCGDANGDGIRDDRCAFWICTDGQCVDVGRDPPQDTGGPFDTCLPDGFCNVHDRNRTLRCFAGNDPCATNNIDIGGPFGVCALDGFCNVHDANFALTCFAGTNTCSCGPQPTAPAQLPIPVNKTVLVVEARSGVAAPRGRITVDVYAHAALDNLQSYQLHLVTSGGNRGQLILEDILVDQRRDTALAGDATFDAVNIETGQMLRGCDGEGRPTRPMAYLATFVYRASSDARGTFVIDVAHDLANDDQTFLISRYVDPIAIVGTVAAVVDVRRYATTRRNLD